MVDYRFFFMNFSKIESLNWMVLEGNMFKLGIICVIEMLERYEI